MKCTIEDLYSLAEFGGKFSCIYADPPWHYSNQSTRSAVGRKDGEVKNYETMTIVDICSLPIKQLAAEDAFLHLWVTNASLFDAPKIFEAWGFKFKSSFVWVKTQMGIGNYWRNSHEFLLTGVRPKAKIKSFPRGVKNLKSWKEFNRTKHSSKPEEVRIMIEKVEEVRAGLKDPPVSPGPYLELFGRIPVKNWTVWGNEINQEDFYGGGKI